MSSDSLSLVVPRELVEAVAERVVEQLEPRLDPAAAPDPWMDVEQAADYMACKAQRIYDLVYQHRLRAARDGRRLLFRRSWLDEYVEGDGSGS